MGLENRTTKNNKMLKSLFTCILLLSTFLSVSAQSGSTTETELELQATFIEGTREQLLGNWDKAIEKYEAVLEKDRTNAATAYQLARVYEAKKDLENAEKYAIKAVDWDGSNEWYHIFLAEIFQKNNKDDLAAKQYEVLTGQHPYKEEFYRKWAYYLVRSGQPEAAIRVYNLLEEKVGIHAETARHKHTLYMGMGHTEMAAAELKKLIEKFPRNTSYRHLLATFYEQIDEKEKAREEYKKILEISPGDARAKIALAEKAKGNDDVQFLHSLKPVFEDPNTGIDTKIKEIFPYVNQLATTAADKNIGNTLLALCSVLTAVHPTEAKAHSVLADVLYYTGHTDSALKEYRKTLELDDTKWPVWEQLLYLYADKKDYDNLLQASQEALDIFPNQATAYYLLGAALNGKGQYRAALDPLQQALLMSRRNARTRYDVLIETGKAFYFLGQYDQSDKAFEDALQINAKDPKVLKNYSYYLAARGARLDKAKALAEQLNQLSPGHPVSLDAMAFVLLQMKDYPAAKKWLDKALRAGGDKDPLILEHYGDTLFHLGNTDQARQYWQMALNNGGNPEILKRKMKEG